MITDNIKRTTEDAKTRITNSSLPEEEKQKWISLMESALENCNGRTQKEKIQGIAEMLLEHTKILAEQRISELGQAGNKELLDKMFAKVSEINQVQNNQQEMMRSMHETVDRLLQLSKAVDMTGNRITNLEQQRVHDMESTENRVNNFVTNTMAGINQIRTEIAGIRDGTKKTQEVFIRRLDEYAAKQDEYDKEQDLRTNARFASVEEKLDSISEGLKKDPVTWKGLISRLFTPKSMAIVIVVLLVLMALQPQIMNVFAALANFVIRIKSGM